MQTLITEFVVTELCNLACEYCYMKDCNTHMTMDDVRHFRKHVQKMMDVYGCKEYHISYFGGEPLVNWDVVKTAYLEFQQDPRLESQVIISNGLLINDHMVEFIKKHNVPFSWSFDGLWQDAQRPHKDIKDTLSLYKEKKHLLHEVANHFCKVMVSPSSVPNMTENFVFLTEEFDIANADFSLVRDDIWSPEDIYAFNIESRRLTEKTIEYFQQGVPAMPGFYALALMDMINGKKHGKRPWGCFACCHGVGYFPSREWYPCARFGAAKEFLIMDAEGELQMDTIRSLYKQELLDPRGFAACKDCSIFEYCNAGCTYSQLNQKTMTAGPVTSVCELFKIIYRESFHINAVLQYNKTYQQYLKNIMRPLGV